MYIFPTPCFLISSWNGLLIWFSIIDVDASFSALKQSIVSPSAIAKTALFSVGVKYPSTRPRLTICCASFAEQSKHLETVTADFRELVLPRYVDNSGSYSRLSCVLHALNELYGELPISEFGPLRMRELRNKLAKSGNRRRYLNDQVRDVVRIV